MQKLRKAGGTAHPPPSKSQPSIGMLLTGKKRPRDEPRRVLPEGVTHVLCEPGCEVQAAKAMGIKSLGSLGDEYRVKCVSMRWLHQSVTAKEKLKEEDFGLDLNAQPAPAASTSKATPGSSSSSGPGSADKLTTNTVNSLTSTSSYASNAPTFSAASGHSTQTSGGPVSLTALSHTPVYHDTQAGTGVAGWREIGSVLYYMPHTRRTSTHIVALDVDSTVITTKSGKKFAENESDWKLWHPTAVTATLKRYYEAGYRVALISNQGGVAAGRVQVSDLMQKMKAVSEKTEVPCEVMLSIGDDLFRKPRPGCWMMLVRDNGGLEPVLSECLYVGDAAGRPQEGGRKKDFSASDIKFAINSKIPFATPEQFFLNSRIDIHCNRNRAELGRNFTSLLEEAARVGERTETKSADNTSAGSSEKEVVVLVAPPASGKSTLCRLHLPEHVRVNQDTLKTLDKCLKEARKALEEGKSVVVDATNTKSAARQQWIQLARATGARVRCIEIVISKDLCFHLNAFRACNEEGTAEEKARDLLTAQVLHSMFKYYEKPTLQEGFDSITRQGFKLERLSEKAEALLHMYLLG